MPSIYILGNLLGRALISYALVWLVCWLASRLNWRMAFTRSGRWVSLLAVIALSLLGFFTVAAILAIHPAALLARPAPREMQIHKVPELGLEIWVENQPAWDAKLTDVARPSDIRRAKPVDLPPTDRDDVCQLAETAGHAEHVARRGGVGDPASESPFRTGSRT